MATLPREPNDSLVCPVCLDLFTSATLLVCGHTFCQECLTGLGSSQPRHNHITCPLCRKDTNLPENGVEGLPKNVTVNSLADDFKRNRTLQRRANTTPTINVPRIQREIDLPAGMRAMAALGPNAIVIGYGSSIPGTECIKELGVRKQHLKKEIGPVRGVVILSDGKAVVSHGSEVQIYNTDSISSKIPFTLNAKEIQRDYWHVCRDQNDNIYAVNGTSEVHIYTIGNQNPTPKQIVLSTGNLKIQQICVTKAGALVLRHSHREADHGLVLMGKDGQVGSSIKPRGEHEFLCAAVDNKDRVIVGYFKPGEGTLTLAICTLQGAHLVNQRFLKEIRLQPTSNAWFAMVSLTPTLLVLGHMGKKLYFINMPA